MKTVFITGATGFIGINLIKYLSQQKDIKLIGYSRDLAAAKQKTGLSRIEWVTEANAESLDRRSVDAVIHLAGIAHDLSGQYEPSDYELVNYQMTANLYEEFLKSSASSFLFMSSIKAVVDTASTPVVEDTSPTPITEYGKSKQKAEKYILEAGAPSHKNFYIFRPCVIYGPGNKGNMSLLDRFVRSGIPYPLGKYINKRSFLFIDNLSFIVNQFIHSPYVSGIYHLADDGELSTVELIRLMAKIRKKKVAIWNFPKGMVNLLATIGSSLGMPFNKQTLSKLTENLVVSSEKLKHTLNKSLPNSTRSGLEITFKDS